MKRLTILAAVMVLAGGLAVAGPPAKTELTFSGSYVNPEQGKAVWQLGAEMLFPVSKKGILVLGPAVAVADDDTQTDGGATLELNIPGPNVGFFVGANGLYYLDSADEQDDYSVDARAGIKLPISKSGLFKIYAQKGIDGRSEESDLTGALAAVIRF